MQVLSRKTESEIPEKDPQHPLHLIQNLLWVGLNSITYMRGIFNGTYFVEKSVETLAMKFNILMPMDAESRRLIDWIDTGISEALQKKYLKTLLFCICDKERSLVLEEYAFSFGYPNNSTEESVMTVRLTGSSKGYTAFASNASEVTPGQMRRSACKMIRLLISLMRTLDPLPEERAIFMKLLYYDDVTPRDYEPPFFKCCAENEAMTFPNKNQLKMEVGNANNNQLFPAVQNLIDSCNKNNSVASVDHELSEAKVLTSEEICYITTPNNDTLHAAQEAVLTSQMKDLMFSTRNALDDFSIPMAPKRTYGYVLVSSAKKIKFMLDSGATHHVCKDKSIMSNLKPLKEEDQVFLSSADGIELRAKEIGSVVTNAIKLSHVGYIPEMAFNVVSVAQLARQGLLIDIANGHFSIISPSDVRLVGEGDLQKRRDKATGRDYHEYIIRTMIWNFPGDAKLIPTCQGNETCKSDKEREVAPDKKGEVAPTDNNSGEGDEEAEEWIIDTGCESHMVPKLGLLKKAKCEQRSFQSASGTFDSSHIGKAQAGQLALEDVLCCPKIQSNLISGSTLDRKGHRIVFYGDRCSIAHKDSLTVQTVATMDDDDNMYVLYVPREHEGSTVKNERKRIPNKAKARVQKRARRV